MITFDEQTHRYYDDKNQHLISVTQLLKKHGLAPDYSSVNPDVLETAQTRGSRIHKFISDACKRKNAWLKNPTSIDTDSDDTDSPFSAAPSHYISNATYRHNSEVLKVMNYVDRKSPMMVSGGYVAGPYDLVKSEQMVSDGHVAGTYDLVFWIGDEDSEMTKYYHVLADIKTGKTIDKKYCAWQLSLYEYLCRHNGYPPFDKLLIFHLPEDLPTKVIDLTDKRIPESEVERLINCDKAGLNYKEEVNKNALESIPNDLIVKLHDTHKKIEHLEELLSGIKQTEKELREKLAEQFKQNHVTSIETERVKITYVPPYSKETFDAKTFKEDNADLYKQYAKQTQVKESLRITIKETQDEQR